MSKNTQHIDGLQIPSGDEIYNALMSQIEPDLLTTNLDTLDEKYANETPEARKERYTRYTAAYVAYDEAFAEWISQLQTAVTNYHRVALHVAENESRHKDDENLSNLESQFGS